MSANTSSTDLTTSTSRTAIFIVYVALCVPSIPCSIFAFVQCLRKRQLLSKISTHIILAVMIYSFFQVKHSQTIRLSKSSIDLFIVGDRRIAIGFIQHVHENSLESHRPILQILELFRLCLQRFHSLVDEFRFG